MKHTPERWKTAKYERPDACQEGIAIIQEGSGALIAEVGCGWPKPERKAHAKLMAASPRVLDALCQLVHDADALLNQRRGSGTNTESAIRTARAAIEAAS